MLRWTRLDDIPAGFGPSVVALGNFDGVHRGHSIVLSRMVDRARDLGGKAVAVTFTPHPVSVHRPEDYIPNLTGDADRLELLAESGIDATLLLAYDLVFAEQSPRDFVLDYLVRPLNAAVVVVGQDVRFGQGNTGDLATMRELGRTYGFAVEVVDDATPDDGGRRWSSSWARELVATGDVGGAAEVLGRWHRMRGRVVEGDRRGRELGFPTANLAAAADGMVPADGVYAGWLRVTDPSASAAGRLPAAISVGTNPTFDGGERRVEAYVLDRDDLELYGTEVVVEFVARLRATERFGSVEALVAQMHDDVGRVRDELGLV